MENQRQKWVNLSFVIAAGLLAYIIHSLLIQFSGAYDLEARFKNIELILTGVSLFFALVLFLYLSRSDKTNQFMNEVIVELGRVTWPSQSDTYRGTIVVMIMVLVAGFFLGGLDSLWSWALSLVL